MRVALCTFGFPELTISLARALKPFCDPSVVLPDRARPAAVGFDEIATFPYVLSNSVPSKARACCQAVRIVSSLKPDVLHLQGWSPLLTPHLPLLRRSAVVFSFHDPVPHSDDQSWSMTVTQKLLVKVSDRVVFLSDAMKAIAAKMYPADAAKMRVVPHGIFNYYVPGPEQRPSVLDPGDKFVLFFGRVARYKGVEDLCEAFVPIASSGYKLVVAGQQIYPVAIPRELGSAIVVLNEYISNDVLRYLFRHCSLVALPYRDATQSGVLMLAYAFGKPVLSTNVGGLAEMVEDGVTGMLVPARNPQALADALTRALTAPKCLEIMGRQALKFANRNFSWEQIARQTFGIYQEAIAMPR